MKESELIELIKKEIEIIPIQKEVIRFCPGQFSVRGIPDLLYLFGYDLSKKYYRNSFWIEIKKDEKPNKSQEKFFRKNFNASILIINNKKNIVNFFYHVNFYAEIVFEIHFLNYIIENNFNYVFNEILIESENDRIYL
jgi:hypothetical protein